MNLATLRVEGLDEALDSIVERLQLRLDARWRKGDPKSRGRGEHASAGLVATVADTSNPVQMIQCIRHFIAKCQAARLSFSNEQVSAEIAVGLTVGDSQQYVAFVDLGPSDMASLGSLGLGLSVAAYPTSDEANEADESE